MGAEPTVGEALDAARDRGFVGRRREYDAVAASLDGRSPTRVHLVHGPGGIGKTTLLDALRRLATGRGLDVVYLDAREIEPTEEALLATGTPDLLLVDGYELLAGLDRWVRDVLLPGRSGDSVTVLAGRAEPERAWREDAGWRALAQIHELGPLDPAESRQLLDSRGVPPEGTATMARLGRGHPLALTMLAEAFPVVPEAAQLGDAPTAVAALCARIVDDVPDEAHRAGLATCAHATRMTQDLLARSVGARAPEVWAWLEGRPYVRRGEIGLYLHDVVREVFEAEMAHRSPDAYAALHRVVRDYFLERLLDPAELRPDRAAAEILLLHRHGPLSDDAATLRDAGVLSVGRAGPEEVERILELIEGGEGARSAALARRYAEQQPAAFYRVGGDHGDLAFASHVYLPTGTDLDRDDPVATAILATVAAHGPLRPGERVNVNRYGGAGGRYQAEPMVLLVNGVSSILEWAHEPAAWTFLVTIDPDRYGPYFEHLGMSRMVEVDVDGTLNVGYGWDRRRFPVSVLFELMARRELSGEVGPPPADLVRPAPLSREEFAAGVRRTLGLLAFPDRLGDSPLIATALVERTYLRGDPSQEAAATLLDLPFSTYRRHLARALDRLTEVLWAIEVGSG